MPQMYACTDMLEISHVP